MFSFKQTGVKPPTLIGYTDVLKWAGPSWRIYGASLDYGNYKREPYISILSFPFHSDMVYQNCIKFLSADLQFDMHESLFLCPPMLNSHSSWELIYPDPPRVIPPLKWSTIHDKEHSDESKSWKFTYVRTHVLIGAKASTSASNDIYGELRTSLKIPKPRGQPGALSRGGYRLKTALGWSDKDYDSLLVHVRVEI